MAGALSAGQLTLLRTHPHKQKRYLAVLASPAVKLACRLNGVPSGDPIHAINYDTVTQGSYTDVVAGMTLYVGSSAGGRDKGQVRVRAAPTSSVLYIAETSHIAWADNDYLTVVEDYDLWPKFPRAVESGGDVTFYKDYNVAYSDQGSQPPPVAVMGPPACANVGDTVKFIGEHSYAVAPGASITGYSWVFPSGTPPSSAVAGTEAFPVEVTWAAAGVYWVSLTVTDDNGKTHTGRRPVFIFDTNNPAYTKFKLRREGGGEGHRAQITVMGDATQNDFPDGALAVEFTEDYYGSTREEIGGFPERENIKFVGRIVKESVTQDPQRVGEVKFEAVTLEAQMRTLHGFPCTVEDKANPTSWHEMQDLTVDRAAYYMLKWHTTALDIADVVLTGTGTNRRLQREDFGKGDPWRQLKSVLWEKGIFARPSCTKQGRLKMVQDEQFLATGDRSAATVMAITKADLRERVDLPKPHIAKLAFIEIGGVYYDGDTATPFLSIAPGIAPQPHGGDKRKESLVITGQSNLNDISGMILANENNDYPQVTFRLAGNYDVFEPADGEYITYSTVAGDTRRGITWTNQKFLVRRVTVNQEEQGVTNVDIVCEKESSGPPGQTKVIDRNAPSAPAADPPVPPGSTVYVLTEDGLFRVTQALTGPAKWADITPPRPQGEEFRDFLRDKFDPDTAYIVGDPKNNSGTAMWKTTNLSDTNPVWTEVLSGQDVYDAGATLRILHAIEGAMTSQGYLVVVGAVDDVHETVVVGHTHDHGDTWTWVICSNIGGVNYGLTLPGDGNVGLEVSDHNANLVLVGATDSSTSPRTTAVLKSSDGAHTFALLHAWLEWGGPDVPYSIHIPYQDNASDNVILVGMLQVDYEVYKSTDGGSVFTLLNGSGGLPANRGPKLNSFECALLDANKYHFFDQQDPSKLYVSGDAATSWTERTAPFQVANVGPGGRWPRDANRFYIARADACSSGQVFAISFDEGDNFVNRTGNYWSIRASWSGARRVIASWT